MVRRLALLALVSPLLACDGGAGAGGAGGQGGGGQGGSGGFVAPVCDVHATTGAPAFVDKTDAWGLGDVDGILLAAADLDGDGYPDLVAHLTSAQRELVGTSDRYYRVLLNEPAPGGGRRFVDHTQDSNYGQTVDGAAGELRAAQMALFADVDNDGDLDAWSGTPNDVNDPQASYPGAGDRNSLLLNDGTGHFELVVDSGVESTSKVSTAGGTFVDWDKDGLLDVFVGYWYGPNGSSSRPRLFKGLGDGTFDDVTTEVGMSPTANMRPLFGVTACDLDGDGWPELLGSAYGRAPNLLFRSGGSGTVEDVALASGYAHDDLEDYSDDQNFLCFCEAGGVDPLCAGAPQPQISCVGSQWIPGYSDQPNNLGGNTFATVCGDLDGDGALDLYNAEIHHWWAGDSSDSSNILWNRTGASG